MVTFKPRPHYPLERKHRRLGGLQCRSGRL